MEKKTKGVMVQGTGSSVGKSLVTCALCRIFSVEGFRVSPFKSQNMALNAYVAKEGGEIGMAQALQAWAAGIEPSVDMNPVLLKPVGKNGSQVIIQGKAAANMTAREYYGFRERVWGSVVESFRRLADSYDVIVAEGAGSPAEVNLYRYDIANMRVAELGGFPVILVADIDKGGVFAQIVGTMELLPEAERERVAGFIINKFRGDRSLLDSGIEFLEKRTGKRVFGVIPYMEGLCLEEEDSTAIEYGKIAAPGAHNYKERRPVIGVVRLPHISNFTDFTILPHEADMRYIFKKEDITSSLDCVIIPGSKNTINDLLYLRENGIAARITEEYERGRLVVLGICGGYQMLGTSISDPHRTESSIGAADGLGLLEVSTELAGTKITRQVSFVPACDIFGEAGEMKGFEIHTGATASNNESGVQPLFRIHTDNGDARFDGAVSQDGRVFGTYMHGLFENDSFRSLFYKKIAPSSVTGTRNFSAAREESFVRLARIVRENLDMERIFELL